ncbi:MAG TPA: putative selenium-dependent hydroxylase accessory protein YqeC [Candidatus Blautia stercorigallinarum]|uniref:Selenium-dependent hydroxylase accessory protein YqeC n=1 Tax=Candidatus Blautia stercorigallinarum TaxID=2838501 RepID=A0A9D1PAT1_9FIRM|nr:putative selenium-dependent hydroxylase accessory protein YqeC [Candidatus Blautia stercorigallinarum]
MKLYQIIEKLGRPEKPVIFFVGAGGKTSCILELADEWAARGKSVLITTTVHMEEPKILGRTGWIDQPAENIRKALETPGVVIAGSGSETPQKIRGLSEEVYIQAVFKAQAVLVEADGSRKFPVKVPGKNEPVIREDTTHILILAGASALGRPLDQVCHRLEYAKKILGPQNRILTAETLAKLLEKGYVEPLKKQYPGRKFAVILNQQELLEEPEKVRAAIEAQMSVPVFLHSREEREKRIRMILLAAGFSRRFGENKLLYPIKGRPMYLWTMERLKEIQKEGLADSLVVVSQYEEILTEAARQGIPGVKNLHSERGISSSLQIGLEEAVRLKDRDSEDYYMFFVADQPFLRKETVENFLVDFEDSGKKIGCMSYRKTPGNPVIFHECFVPDLMTLQGDTGGKKVLKKHLEEVFFYEVQDPGELEDWDIKRMNE